MIVCIVANMVDNPKLNNIAKNNTDAILEPHPNYLSQSKSGKQTMN